MRLSRSVEIGYIETCIGAIIAPRTKYNPPPVAAPSVIAVGIVAIRLAERISLARLQVLHPEVCAFVPNMELPVIALGVKQVTAVGTHAGQRGALAARRAIDYPLRRTPLPRADIKRQAQDVVPDGWIMQQQVARRNRVGMRIHPARIGRGIV